jgi:hypothetical protein
MSGGKTSLVHLSPSLSSQKLILVWPRPIVYFPWLTPSNFSSSVWSTHWQKEAVSLIHGYLLEKQENLKYLCVPGPENKSQWP